MPISRIATTSGSAASVLSASSAAASSAAARCGWIPTATRRVVCTYASVSASRLEATSSPQLRIRRIAAAPGTRDDRRRVVSEAAVDEVRVCVDHERPAEVARGGGMIRGTGRALRTVERA